MVCNGRELVWEDYNAQKEWNIKKLSLKDGGEAENILTYDSQKGRLYSITPTITETGLLWYEQVDETDRPIALLGYDFPTGKRTEEKKGLSLVSPYEHVSLVNGYWAVYEEEIKGKSNIIHTYHQENKTGWDIHVNGGVIHPACNGQICVWMQGYDLHENGYLYLCHIPEQTIEKINVQRGLSYGLLENAVLVHQSGGIYCYDTEKKEYMILLPEGENSYGYIFQGLKGNLYFEEVGSSDKLVVIQVK